MHSEFFLSPFLVIVCHVVYIFIYYLLAIIFIILSIVLTIEHCYISFVMMNDDDMMD